jgi:hypothetical protein
LTLVEDLTGSTDHPDLSAHRIEHLLTGRERNSVNGVEARVRMRYGSDAGLDARVSRCHFGYGRVMRGHGLTG